MRVILNTEKKTIIILTIFFISTLLVLFGIMMPTIYYIRNLNEETIQLREYLEKKYENTRAIRSSKKMIDEMNSIVVKYPDYLFFKGDELQLITTLENLAAANKITQKIDSSNLDSIKGDSVNISLSLTGDFENILKYLTALEKEKYFFVVSILRISSAYTLQNNDPKATVVNLDLILYVNNR